MLELACFALWCEVKNPLTCQLEKTTIMQYHERRVGEYRTIPYMEDTEMKISEQKLERGLGCWYPLAGEKK